ncbi:hypothetical protein PQD71_gp145 [Kosakonia phage Kc263]|uniref:Uncharacterized protein n=1 Tax=Kosakonia phage Kc263 TaxID=2863194 RepID=A0AAE7WFQ3_9CAUD|nr:hypothetical protein PQD71_gp145 [Kosakonia phage Kc263]QYN80038.1 hypothetical protein [Kosakonia phage Kc263]
MYNFDQRNLRTSIAIALTSQLKEDEKLEECVNYYLILVLDMVLGAMNSNIRNIDSAIDEQYERYPDDYRLGFLAEVIRQEVFDIKKQFILSGFDNRLRYKLVTHSAGTFKRYGIAMDLDATYNHMLDLDERRDNHEQDLGYLVSDYPSAEELSRAFDW